MQKINLKKQLDDVLSSITKSKATPKLLLHSCCAPCSSHVLEFLSPFFNITVFYYNPNIYPYEEFLHRKQEQKRLVELLHSKNRILLEEGNYEQDLFFNEVKGLEKEEEGQNRCYKCYFLRMEKTAKKACEENYDYFCTTLSVSPHKDCYKINDIGNILQNKYNIKYLFSDFKKYGGYQRSIELTKKYNIYRQNYCGCKFSN